MSLDLFHPEMSVREVNEISSLGLAHIGDAVYEKPFYKDFRILYLPCVILLDELGKANS